MHRYRAHGLRIASDLTFEELVPGGEGPPDLTIALDGSARTAAEAAMEVADAVPWHGLLPVPSGGHVVVVKGVMALFAPGAGRLIVDPEPGHEPGLLRLILVGSGLALALHAIGALPMHGAAIVSERGAHLILGPSGAGKSTLTAALRRRGYPILGDDVVRIEPAGRGWVAHPAGMMLKLGRESLETLAAAPEGSEPISSLHRKFYLKAPPHLTAAPLAEVLLLDPSDADAPGCRPMTGLEALRALSDNVFRPEYAVFGGAEARFRGMTELLACTEVNRLTRPWSLARLDETAGWLADRVGPPARMAALCE